jgi:hypothetical protein
MGVMMYVLYLKHAYKCFVEMMFMDSDYVYVVFVVVRRLFYIYMVE